MSKETNAGHGAVAGRVERPVRPLSARLDVLRVLLATNHPEHHAAVAEAQAEIERAWAQRDAAVSDLEAHAAAEVRRAVAAERERWRLRVLGLQAQYDDPACRAALKHASVYGAQPEA